nr:MAG TPA: hypothetical protein [Caudoviricetes sp.]
MANDFATRGTPSDGRVLKTPARSGGTVEHKSRTRISAPS